MWHCSSKGWEYGLDFVVCYLGRQTLSILTKKYFLGLKGLEIWIPKYTGGRGRGKNVGQFIEGCKRGFGYLICYSGHQIRHILATIFQILMDNILGVAKMWHSSSSDTVGDLGF